MADFEIIDSSPVLDVGFFSVARKQVRGATETFERHVVHHTGAVGVVPLTKTGTVLLVRQYRASVDRELLEIPAGKCDVDGEPPDATAHRELAEEVGRRTNDLVLLGEFYNSPGFTDEYSWVYLARDLEECATAPAGHEEAAMTIEELALVDALAMINAREIVDAKTMIGLLLAERFLTVER